MQSEAATVEEPTPTIGAWALPPGAAEVETPASVIQPDPKVALAFFAALFKPGDCLHFRAVPEPPDGRTPSNHHYLMDGGFADTLAQFLEYCAVEKRAAFFLPGAVIPGRTHKDAVKSLPVVVADFDKGDPAANLARAEAAFGPATAVIESGGQTESGPKLHAYWALPDADQTAIEQICAARENLARTYEGDPAFKQQAQVIRTPGSVHWKHGARLVQLRALRPGTKTALSMFLGAAPHNTKVVNFFDFNNVSAPVASVEDLRSMYVETEGKSNLTRWEWFNRVAGAEIMDVRAGRKTLEEAERYMLGAVQRSMEHPEDWDDTRVAREFAALARIDVESRGPFARAQPAIATGASNGTIADWNIKRFSGAPPERRWLVEGLIPAGTAGVFAAVGDAGKSMMALRLAYIVGGYPEPKRNADFAFDVPRFFGQPVVARGAAVVLTAEDDADEVHRRIAALDQSNLRARDTRVYVRPLLSDGGPRAIVADTPAGVQPTDFWRELRSQLLAVPDLRLVVLDPLSHFAAIKLDNDNQAGATLMSMLGAFAAESGATVMLIHHMGKAAVPTSLSDARTAIRGAGALVDNGRWALAMWEADQDRAYSTLKALGQEERARGAGVVYLGGLTKGNAPSDKVLRTLVRNASNGLLEDMTDRLAAARPRQAEVDEGALAALRAEARDNPRFMFGRGEQTLWKAWQPILSSAGVQVPRADLPGLFGRLHARGALVRTDTVKGGHSQFGVQLEG